MFPWFPVRQFLISFFRKSGYRSETELTGNLTSVGFDDGFLAANQPGMGACLCGESPRLVVAMAPVPEKP